jgi:hypothetical protein
MDFHPRVFDVLLCHLGVSPNPGGDDCRPDLRLDEFGVLRFRTEALKTLLLYEVYHLSLDVIP